VRKNVLETGDTYSQGASETLAWYRNAWLGSGTWLPGISEPFFRYNRIWTSIYAEICSSTERYETFDVWYMSAIWVFFQNTKNHEEKTAFLPLKMTSFLFFRVSRKPCGGNAAEDVLYGGSTPIFHNFNCSRKKKMQYWACPFKLPLDLNRSNGLRSRISPRSLKSNRKVNLCMIPTASDLKISGLINNFSHGRFTLFRRNSADRCGPKENQIFKESMCGGKAFVIENLRRALVIWDKFPRATSGSVQKRPRKPEPRENFATLNAVNVELFVFS
jgi:hypothetical protein